MCLAIYKPADTAPDWDAYDNGHWHNDDSWGFASVVDGKIVRRRGVGTFAEFRAAFEPFANRQSIIHFRYATHGETSKDNAHPFMVSKGVAMIHNGVLDINCNLNKRFSDTWHYVQLVLKPMIDIDPDFFHRQHVCYAMGMAIKGNKMCFLRDDGKHAIWNEEDGVVTPDGHWYSNNSFQRSYRWGLGNSHRASVSIWEDAASATATDKPSDDTPKWWQCSDKFSDSDKCGDSDESSVVTAVVSEPSDEPDVTEYEYEDENEVSGYTDIRMHDLIQYGISRKCLDEIKENLGHYAIEALHDLI
jgi:hypothetical protein